MNKTFTKLKGSLAIAAVLATMNAGSAFAQLNYRPNTATSPNNAVNTTGTYTDLGTNGTVITTANNDNANSAATPIGFTFNYNGQAFTDFVLNTNGLIKLGSTAPSTAAITNFFAINDQNIIAPLAGVDLQGAADQVANPTEFRVETTGTAPNRVTTIQFENLADKATPSASANAQFTAINFQIKLYETTNVIEFVYGPWISNGATPTSGQPFLIGLKGSSSAQADRLLAFKPSSATAWTVTTFSQVEGGLIPSHFVRNTFLPDAGRTYRFTPIVIPANDMGVLAVFAQGKMARLGGGPQVIQALVKNNGSAAINNRTITLNITGFNTFTSAVTLGTLAAGQDSLISFAPFTPTVNGPNNLVEVTVPSDDDNGNNIADANIVVTSSTQGYAQYPNTANAAPTIQTALSGVYPATGTTAATRNSNFLVRFKSTGRTRVNTVRAYVPGAAFNPVVNTTGATVYGIVFNSAGVEVARSANRVLTASDVDKLVSFTLTTPATFENNEIYYVGMALPAQSVPATAPATIYGMGVQAEQNASIRPNTFFVSPVTTTAVIPVDFDDEYRFVIEADIVDVTGIKEELNAKLVSVYPNPSTGVFNVSAKAMKGSNLNLEVRDLQGRLVYSAAASKDNATINLKNVAAGVYMLQVSTDSEVAIKRIVVE